MDTEKKKHRAIDKGFSLVELVVVVAVVGIASAVAIPAVLNWLPDIRLNNAVRDLYGVMMQAKVEAAKRNNKCTLVFNQVLGGSTYAYVLFEDLQDNSVPSRESEYDPGEQIITQLVTWPKGITLDLTKGGSPGSNSGFDLSNNDDGFPSISFLPTSLPTDNGGGVGSGSIYLTNQDPLNHPNGKNKSVVVGPAGNVRTINY